MINPYSVCSTQFLLVLSRTLGTLSKDDDEGSENVVKKWICVFSNLIASIWTRSICQMQATFPGVEFLRILFRIKKRKENSSSYMFTSSTSRQIRRFYVEVVQWTSKKCTKKRDTRAELLLSSLNLLFFWTPRCGRGPVKLWFSIKLTATEFFSAPFNCWMAI